VEDKELRRLMEMKPKTGKNWERIEKQTAFVTGRIIWMWERQNRKG